MQIVIPNTSWAVDGSDREHGDLVGVTVITTDSPRDEAARICTMLRTGGRMGPNGSVHGTLSDGAATAALAVSSLLLGFIPIGLAREEARTQVNAALDQADALGRDHAGWDPTPLDLNGVSYALWVLHLPGGVAAHADLGWGTVTMWSSSHLPVGPFTLVEHSGPEEGAQSRIGLRRMTSTESNRPADLAV